MSFPRLSLLALPVILGLPLLTGACGAPLAVTAASYGTDGALMAKTNKTTTDHFASMVTKEDCALWRIFKHQKICKPRETDHDPYQVNYEEPFRMQAEGAGVSYAPPLHASSDAPVTAWEASAYKTGAPNEPQTNSGPQTASVAKQPLAAPDPAQSAEATSAAPTTAPVATPAPEPKKVAAATPAKSSKKKVAKTKPKKPSPNQVASVH